MDKNTITGFEPWMREIAKGFLSTTNVFTRASICRAFGAVGVHTALAAHRAAVETREEEFYAMVRDSENAEPCQCSMCVVYGGDCPRALAAEGLREYLAKWRRGRDVRAGRWTQYHQERAA